MNARDIVKALQGRWHGSYGMARCPCHVDKTPSLKVSDGATSVVVHCFAGCDWRDVKAALRRRGLISDLDGGRGHKHQRAGGATANPRSKAQHDRDSKRRTAAALYIWQASRPAPGTSVETYLAARGIGTAVPPSIRYHPALKHHFTGLCFEAMIAAVQDPDRRVTGVHRTWLQPGGGGKAQISQPKLSLGPIGCGAVRLARAAPVLGLAEGIETGLAAMQLFEVPVWCALGSRLSRIALPSKVRHIIIFADSGSTGLQAAEKAIKVFAEMGRKVTLCLPDDGDFNNVLRNESAL